MSLATNCPACAIGNHAHHNRAHGLKPGLIGGTFCDCAGDCAERSAAAAERVRDLLASSAPATASECPTVCDDDCEAPCHEDHLVTAKRAHGPSDHGVTSPDGYRVSMDLATGNISVSQWSSTSSDGDRGLREEEIAQWLIDRERGGWQYAVERILAARTAQPEGVERVECDHPGIDHSPFSYTGICPKCRRCKFIGHGPLCADCYTAATEEATRDE